jgi:hypothetical protein
LRCDPERIGDLSGKIALVDRGTVPVRGQGGRLAGGQGAVAVVVVNNVGGARQSPWAAPIRGDHHDSLGDDLPWPTDKLIKDALEERSRERHACRGRALRACAIAISTTASSRMNTAMAFPTGSPADPSNTDCLFNDEQMGEGWSDWMGMVLTMQVPAIWQEAGRTVGTFVKDEGPDGSGIRPAPYSTDLGVNPYTYGITNTGNFQETHALGFRLGHHAVGRHLGIDR